MTEPEPIDREQDESPIPCSQRESVSPMPEPRPQGRGSSMAIQGILTVLVVVIFMVTFVVQAFRVPSESMENTLLIGDFLLADKLHFGNSAGIWNKLLPYRPIQRGDVIVFRYPIDPSQYFVKRVVGLPLDHIRLRNGVVYVNGSPLTESYVIHSDPHLNFYRDNFPARLEMGPEVDRKWRRQLPKHLENGELLVPADAYFVLGDNRDRSLDSRYWGFVPRANVMGRPLLIYMSMNEGATAERRASNGKLVSSGSVLAHLFELARWDRILHLVH